MLNAEPCIILDMDGTLIARSGREPVARPHLETFLKRCFESFKHVAIWTAASSGWYIIVYTNVLQPILHKLGRTFSFIYTQDKCVWKEGSWLKPLSKIWRRKTGPWADYFATNTLLVEDTPEVCALNRSSCIIVPSYEADDPHDKTLLALSRDIPVMLAAYRKTGDIRKAIPARWRCPKKT